MRQHSQEMGIRTLELAGLYNVGSGSAGLARALADIGLAGDVAMAAHDLTDQHRSLLSNGSFAYLLTQDIHYCVGVAARVLRALCENVYASQPKKRSSAL